jgi:metal-responsive CopG/Arc/MetJ family transcriptional regulator
MKSEYDFSRGKRGPVIPVPRGKTRITIRLDKELIDWFRSQVEAAGGGNYQTLINSALREYIRQTASEIAEEVARYGDRSSARKGAGVTSVRVDKSLLSRSDRLARALGWTRNELIERGMRAVLAALGKNP